MAQLARAGWRFYAECFGSMCIGEDGAFACELAPFCGRSAQEWCSSPVRVGAFLRNASARTIPNHVAGERSKGGEHWNVLSTFAESAESGVLKRMPNQRWRHHIALCKSGVHVHNGHGEDDGFAWDLAPFCGRSAEEWCSSRMRVGAFLQHASAGCVLCHDESLPKLHTAA